MRMQVFPCRSGGISCLSRCEAGALLNSCCAKHVLRQGNAPFIPCSVQSTELLFPACNSMQHPQEHDFAWMLRVRGLPEFMGPEGKETQVRQSAQLGDFQDFYFTSAACCSTLQLPAQAPVQAVEVTPSEISAACRRHRATILCPLSQVLMQEHLAISMFEDVFEGSTASGAARPLVVQYHMQLDPFLVPGATRYQMLMSMTSKPGGWVVCCQWLHCRRVVFKATQHAAKICRKVHRASAAAQPEWAEVAPCCSLQPWRT